MQSQIAKVFDVDRAMISRFWWETWDHMASNNHTIEDVTHDIGFLKSNITTEEDCRSMIGSY